MDDIFGVRKHKKKLTLSLNKYKGKLAEEAFVMKQKMQGNEVTRTGRGSDYAVRKVHPFTRERGPKTLVEVKSSKTAPVSKLQKKTQKKTSRYKVVREGWW